MEEGKRVAEMVVLRHFSASAPSDRSSRQYFAPFLFTVISAIPLSFRSEPQDTSAHRLSSMVLGIHELDDDVLTHIFEELAELDDPGTADEEPARTSMSTISGALIAFGRRTYYSYPFPDHPPRRRLGWVAATHVCRRWRIIILTLSALWKRIIFSFPRSRDAHFVLLQRAGGASLDLNLQRMNRGLNQHTFALEHIESARTLQGLFPGRLHEEVHELLSSRRLPQLTDINIAQRGARLPDSNDPLTKSTFCLDAPNLRAATLSGLRCYFTSSQLRSLRLLAPSGCSDWSGRLPGLLRNTPLLEILHCDMDYSPPQMRGQRHDGIVRLPNLQTVCIRWDSSTVPDDAHIFIHDIDIPPSCTFHINDISSAPQDSGWRKSLDICSTRWSLCPYNAVALYMCYPSDMGSCIVNVNTFHTEDRREPFGYYVAPYTAEHCCANIRTPATQYNRLNGHRLRRVAPGIFMSISKDQELEEWDWEPEDISREIVSHLRSDSVTHFVLNGFGPLPVMTPNQLRSVLQPLVAVTSLFVISPRNNVLRLPFVSTTDSGNTGLPAAPLFPALRDLTIGCDEIDTQAYDWDGYSGPDWCNAWWSPLLAFLEHRQRIGLPVHTLRVNGWWRIESARQVTALADQRNMQRARELAEGGVIDDRVVENVNIYA
ncbi:unnamed protein product [Peniophora sp. CBMAI 1063]|nr:unnamed protein product [Peniophora sp. CBMAI 1063]